MRVVSPILRRVVYPSLGRVGCFRDGPAVLSVVTYHGVLPQGYRVTDPYLDSTLVSAEQFRAQLRLLKADYNIISCRQFLDWLNGRDNLPPRAILLTCDDGQINNLTEMVPILKEENLECLFFVTGASATTAGGMLWYEELYLMLMKSPRQAAKFVIQNTARERAIPNLRARRALWRELLQSLSRLPWAQRRAFLDEAVSALGLDGDWKSVYFEDDLLRRRFVLLDSSAVRQLGDAGMSIGAHSVSHPVLSELGAESAEAEIADSRSMLQSVTPDVWAFAYPFGDMNSAGPREFALTQKAGFQCAFMNEGGTVDANSSPFALPRVHISREMGLREFEAHVSGFHHRLRSRLWVPQVNYSARRIGGDACA